MTRDRRNLLAAGLAALLALAPAAAPAAPEDAWIVEIDSYTMRAAPKTGSKVVGRARLGEKVRVLGRDDGWAEIETGEGRGWVIDSAVGREAPAVSLVGPLQDRVGGLEASVASLEAERDTLRADNTALEARVGELEEALERARRDAASARGSGRFREMALGGGLVVLGWIAGFAFAALRRRRAAGTRYTIG